MNENNTEKTSITFCPRCGQWRYHRTTPKLLSRTSNTKYFDAIGWKLIETKSGVHCFSCMEKIKTVTVPVSFVDKIRNRAVSSTDLFEVLL